MYRKKAPEELRRKILASVRQKKVLEESQYVNRRGDAVVDRPVLGLASQHQVQLQDQKLAATQQHPNSLPNSPNHSLNFQSPLPSPSKVVENNEANNQLSHPIRMHQYNNEPFEIQVDNVPRSTTISTKRTAEGTKSILAGPKVIKRRKKKVTISAE